MRRVPELQARSPTACRQRSVQPSARDVALSVSQPAAWEREIASLEWAAGRTPKASRVLLVVHEDPARKPPAGIKIVEAWRYLLGIG
jgi:hypothetical protein